VFYLHSRLLERAAKMAPEFGGGSLTALPIIETQLGDVSAYIPTNVISITDGQIYLVRDLFNIGIRPAVDVGISVSRVGGKAQIRAMRQVAGGLRLDMSQFRDLAAFAQFGSELDRATRQQIERGLRLQEILKQPQYQPMPVEQQVMILYAGTHGYVDDVPIDKVAEWETRFHRFMASTYLEVGQRIREEKRISEETEALLVDAIEAFRQTVEFRAAESSVAGPVAA
jgi:F-type H+-transporting ATPase subunit alpha